MYLSLLCSFFVVRGIELKALRMLGFPLSCYPHSARLLVMPKGMCGAH